MQYILDTVPSEDAINHVRNGLVEHNTPFLQGISQSVVGYYAYNADEKVGGIIADIWGHWLLVKFLWVDKSVRGTQVGSMLLQHMENYAQSLGCQSALVDTFSFQARPFYEKHGYECQMVLDNYPVDTSIAYVTKLLVAM